MDALLGMDCADHTGSVLDEVDTFLREPTIPRKEDPLSSWKANTTRFPQLAAVAGTIACIPATSTQAERVFSPAGVIVDKRRSRLASDMVDGLVFLNKNRALFGDVKKEEERLPSLFQPIEDNEDGLPVLPQLDTN